MPTNEKEINNYLFDQLYILERIEDALDEDGIDAPRVRKCIEREKAQINRKLYQRPPLVSE